MATGIEAAGLVLSSIPLILAGLQFYAEGISVTKRYWRYKEEIRTILYELGAENTMYINSINMLLIGVVSQKDMAEFLTDPGGTRWKDVEFDRKLHNRLGSSYESYMESIVHLGNATEKFKEKLKLDASGKPQFSEKGAFREHYKRLKFSLKRSDYSDLMGRLRQANQSLYRLTTQTAYLDANQVSSEKGRQSVPNFRVIKDRADSFYLALTTGWNCPCQVGHSVHLRLETRIEDASGDGDDEEDTMRDPFHVLFRYSHHHTSNMDSKIMKYPWTWEEADVRVEYNDQHTVLKAACGSPSAKGVRFEKQAQKAVQAALDPQPNLQPIQDLCSAICALQKPQREVCFSLLESEIAKQKYGVRIYPMKQPPPDTDSWSDVDGPQATGYTQLDAMTEYNTADRLVEELYSEAGGKYSDAVRRCIRCDFDRRASSLEDIQFQKAVYQGVVAQLKENYEFMFQHQPD
ncbi:hypothetical protein BKA66DRAFT_534758 [Pyrenochaeta sp. MPI-SDFR-AT-0127]|nr:hypothetical protein BKA66DRAFT_534758 [Pyrenochaeta sp. MPI-SDFR-AT-0127]